MSGYNELIDNYEVMRESVRQYFAFGTQSRSEYAEKSGRKKSQDLIVRRLNSWMQNDLSYYTNARGERVYYFSVDSRLVLQNPLYRTYLSKSVRTLQTRLFFYALAALSDQEFRSVHEITDTINALVDAAGERLDEETFSELLEAFSFDGSSLRSLLNELCGIGMLEARKTGKTYRFRLKHTDLSLPPLKDAIFFASEQDPVGVIGYYLLNRMEGVPNDIRFKHHCFLNALNDGLLYELFDAMQTHRWISIRIDRQPNHPIVVYPLKLYLGVQNGRQHLLCYDAVWKKPCFIRIDRIRDVAPSDIREVCPLTEAELAEFEAHLWGTGYSPALCRQPQHVGIRLHVSADETFLIRRLEREKRNAVLEQISDTEWKITTDVYDPHNMSPWILSLIGRIRHLSCSDPSVEERFRANTETLYRLYTEDRPFPVSPARESRHTVLKPDAKHTPLQLFHEVYGVYYGTAAAFLRELGGKHCGKAASSLGRLLTDSFADAKVNLLKLMKEDWMLLLEDPADKTLFSPIQKLPPFPLTTPELRWMKTVFADPRVSLFLPEEGVPALDGVEPLYTPDQIVYYDRYADGDPFTDPKYRAVFRTVLHAIREHRKLGIRFLSTNTGKERTVEVCPYRLEYSEKDDKFRLITCSPDRPPMQINLASVLSCEDRGAFLPNAETESVSEGGKTLELLLLDERNALERVLLHFSDLKKKTERIDGDRYRVTLTYRASDEKEMVMRILSFGSLLKVVSPDSVKEEIRNRILRQHALLLGEPDRAD